MFIHYSEWKNNDIIEYWRCVNIDNCRSMEIEKRDQHDYWAIKIFLDNGTLTTIITTEDAAREAWNKFLLFISGKCRYIEEFQNEKGEKKQKRKTENLLHISDIVPTNKIISIKFSEDKGGKDTDKEE